MDGVLNINKPSGMTSHDVVLQVRRLLKEKRVGHTGTLDPSATGVLVLCVGKATRIARYLEAGEKEYSAVMQLGITTDTLDADGRVLTATDDYVVPEKQTILSVLDRFTGSILQTPPAFSAIKVGGVPSYKLARQGKSVTLEARAVTVSQITLTAYDNPYVEITVRCSKGVYIRTLCADIGAALGMGAHLTKLVRTRSGRFRIEDALKPEQLATQGQDAMLLSVNEALDDLPFLALNEDDCRKISHGNSIMTTPAPENNLFRLQDKSGKFLAVGRSGGDMIQPEVVF